MTVQKSEFMAGEADAWFRRNREHLTADSALRSVAVARIAAHVQATDAAVLEIGCGRGDNLAALAAALPIRGHGIDPSREGIDAGKQAYASFDLRCATADALPFEDQQFDVVWFGFCLYLVDRELLMRCMAEADRVLKSGGLLCIIDFDPGAPSKRAYHHRPGLWSYKMDYAALFLANPAYVLVEKMSLSHAQIHWDADPQERIGLWLCRKDSAHAYRIDE